MLVLATQSYNGVPSPLSKQHNFSYTTEIWNQRHRIRSGEGAPLNFMSVGVLRNLEAHSTVAVHATPLALAPPLAPPLLRNLEEAEILAAVPVQRADGRRVVVRLPSGDAHPIIDQCRSEFLPEHVDQLAFVNGDGQGSA